MTDLGQQIRRERLARGMSIAELAQRSGASRWTIASLERGHSQVGLEWATRICHALGVRLTLDIGAKPCPPSPLTGPGQLTS